ncbi:Nn.00g113310.m01.CDS01 [Neocucurbitaria sp. VM-36]
MPNSGVDAQNASHDPLHSEVSLSFVARNDNDLRRGAETYAELSSSGNRSHEVGRGETYLPQEGPPHPYNMHRKSVSLASPATAPMQLLPYPSSRHSSAPPQAAGQSNFAAFGRLFNNSADAKRHRHIKMRFDRHAYDENDSSIALVEAHRQRHVERIYNAMTRGDLARDNAGSTAMKRWTREPHYPSDLVEAYAHKVFDCLLEQAKEGFRGWHHNDYVADDRKGEDEDRDVNCAGRLENVINALELEKTICEDVMNSACQIRMFVNAPKAYSNRKHQNRVGNSKRPGAKASTLDPTTRSSKVRKTSDRRSRARSSTTSSMITSSNVTVQPPREMSIMPPFTNPALQRVSSSAPSGGFHAPQAPAMHQPIVRSQRSSFGQHQATPISPSATSPRATSYTISLPHIPRITSMPPAQQSPFLSPPLLSQGHFSAPATPDDMNSSNVDAPLNSWPQTSMCSDSFSAAFQGSHTSGDTCFPQVADWSQNVSTFAPFTPCELAGTANYFEHHPEIGVTMADVEQQPPTQVGDISHNVDLSSVWQQQQSVQPFTYNGLPSEYPNQL